MQKEGKALLDQPVNLIRPKTAIEIRQRPQSNTHNKDSESNKNNNEPDEEFGSEASLRVLKAKLNVATDQVKHWMDRAKKSVFISN